MTQREREMKTHIKHTHTKCPSYTDRSKQACTQDALQLIFGGGAFLGLFSTVLKGSTCIIISCVLRFTWRIYLNDACFGCMYPGAACGSVGIHHTTTVDEEFFVVVVVVVNDALLLIGRAHYYIDILVVDFERHWNSQLPFLMLLLPLDEPRVLQRFGSCRSLLGVAHK